MAPRTHITRSAGGAIARLAVYRLLTASPLVVGWPLRLIGRAVIAPVPAPILGRSTPGGDSSRGAKSAQCAKAIRHIHSPPIIGHDGQGKAASSSSEAKYEPRRCQAQPEPSVRAQRSPAPAGTGCKIASFRAIHLDREAICGDGRAMKQSVSQYSAVNGALPHAVLLERTCIIIAS